MLLRRLLPTYLLIFTHTHIVSVPSAVVEPSRADRGNRSSPTDGPGVVLPFDRAEEFSARAFPDRPAQVVAATVAAPR